MADDLIWGERGSGCTPVVGGGRGARGCLQGISAPGICCGVQRLHPKHRLSSSLELVQAPASDLGSVHQE